MYLSFPFVFKSAFLDGIPFSGSVSTILQLLVILQCCTMLHNIQGNSLVESTDQGGLAARSGTEFT